jgi:hypothetical protein
MHIDNKKELLYVVYKVPVGACSPQRAHEKLSDFNAMLKEMFKDTEEQFGIVCKHVLIPTSGEADVLTVWPLNYSDNAKAKMAEAVEEINNYY